jgi:glycosyltransferase involved in cell wall biosynthesis
LNIHNEINYFRRTAASYEEATRFASGYRVELVIVLDRTPAAMADAIRAYRADCYTDVRFVEADNGSLGLSRNDGIRAAKGRYIKTCDADDLVSYNIIVEMLRVAEADGPDCLVFAEYYMEFGASHGLVRYYGLDTVTPLSFIDFHPYVSRFLARRELLEAIPFSDLRLGPGYAFEDWHFNCEAVAAGYNCRIAPGTVVFYRKREGSLLASAEKISSRQPPPSRLFEPSVYLERGRAAYEQMAPAGKPRRVRALPEDRGGVGAMVNNPFFRELFLAANRIDPGLDLLRYYDVWLWSPASIPIRTGLAYYDVCLALGKERFTDIFLMPFIVTGGAEKFLLGVMNGLAEALSSTRVLVLCGQSGQKHVWVDRLPAGAVFIDLPAIDAALTADDIDLLTLKIIQSVGGRARLHLKQCEFVERFFHKYRRVLGGNRNIFYRFTDDRYALDGRFFTESRGFEFISDCLDSLHLIISDHVKLVAEDRRRFGVQQTKWQVLPARCDVHPGADIIVAQNGAPVRRLLWASRLDRQKRPELLPLIAAKLNEHGLNIAIDIYGAAVLAPFNPAIFARSPGLAYKGAFQDFANLPLGQYDGFLYTSAFDGLPNVVLEAMAAGLPVIAPSIDGLPEVVIPGRTGLLVENSADDAELAKGYSEAIMTFYKKPEELPAMRMACVDMIKQRHGAAAYQTRLLEIFS